MIPTKEKRCLTALPGGAASGSLPLAEVPEPVSWHAERHAAAPDEHATRGLIEEWMRGTLEQTRLACSPHRVQDVRERIILEWDDSPTTATALALIPAWVHWCAEQTGLTPELTANAHNAATHPPDTPGKHKRELRPRSNGHAQRQKRRVSSWN